MIKARPIALVTVTIFVLVIIAYSHLDRPLEGRRLSAFFPSKSLSSDSHFEHLHTSASPIWKQHQTLLTNPHHPRVFLLLPITHSSLEFCQSLYTAFLQGYEPILLNWGRDLPSRWTWWDKEIKPDRMSKIRKVAEWLEREEEGWRDDDVVITADATDLWFQVDRCLITQLNQPYDIITSAEKFCWPSNQWFMCDDYELKAPGNEVINKNGEVLDRRSLPRYSNAGLYIGRHRQLGALFHEMNTLIPLTNLWDDQGILHLETYSGAGNRYNMSMDYGSSMIYTLAFGGGEFGLRGLERIPDGQDYVRGVRGQLDDVKGLEKRQYYDDSIPWVDEDGLVFTPDTDELGPNRWAFGHNHQTDRTSAALHFNGDNKLQAIPRTWGKMYWATGGSKGVDLEVMREVVRRGKVRIGETGQVKNWDEICGRFGLAGEGE